MRKHTEVFYETFGSNMTNLYYYLFAMENSQIGELAKNLINEVIEYIHNSEGSENYHKMKYYREYWRRVYSKKITS